MKKVMIFFLLALPALSIAQIAGDTSAFEIADVDQKASFPGGDVGLQKYLAVNLKYPLMALEQDAQGTITVMFVVKKDGTISDIKRIGKRQNKHLEAEAIRVVKSTSGMWKPAVQRDKPVNMRFRIPVRFEIYGGDTKVKKKRRLFRRN
jgi:TonB family protein